MGVALNRLRRKTPHSSRDGPGFRTDHISGMGELHLEIIN